MKSILQNQVRRRKQRLVIGAVLGALFGRFAHSYVFDDERNKLPVMAVGAGVGVVWGA